MNGKMSQIANPCQEKSQAECCDFLADRPGRYTPAHLAYRPGRSSKPLRIDTLTVSGIEHTKRLIKLGYLKTHTKSNLYGIEKGKGRLSNCVLRHDHQAQASNQLSLKRSRRP